MVTLPAELPCVLMAGTDMRVTAANAHSERDKGFQMSSSPLTSVVGKESVWPLAGQLCSTPVRIQAAQIGRDGHIRKRKAAMKLERVKVDLEGAGEKS